MLDRTASLLYELRQHDFFAALDEDALRDLTETAQTKIIKARQALCRQGDEGDSLYIILSGRLKVFTTSSAGKETVLTFMGPGDVLGEIAVLDGGMRTATATAIEEVRVLLVRQNVLFDFLERHPAVARNIIRVLCQRLRQTSTIVEEMTTLQAAPRLARALLRLAEQHGKPDEDGILINIKLSQSNLGAHAGLMRENVNRQLKVWEVDGILINQGGMIRLRNVEALREIAETLEA